MGFINLFPSVVLSDNLSDISDEKLKDWKNFIKTSELVNEGTNGKYTSNQNLLENNIFFELNSKILNISRNYLNELGHTFTDIQIASSWGNILHKNETIHPHSHTNSYICGSFYLDYSSPISFFSPLLKKWQFRTSINSNENQLRKQIKYNIDLKPKSILIFPPWLEHSVPNSQNFERISIAFNFGAYIR